MVSRRHIPTGFEGLGFIIQRRYDGKMDEHTGEENGEDEDEPDTGPFGSLNAGNSEKCDFGAGVKS